MTKAKQKADEKILADAKEQLEKAITDDSENRKLALSDLEFIAVDKAQWPNEIRTERESQGRPCLTINKMPTFVDQVAGDQRMNRPGIKVLPVDSDADVETARIIGGWIRHVQQISKADVAVDHAFEHAVTCGYGAWRIVTKYVSDTSFDQEAYIEKIDDALSVYWGKHTEYDCSDASYCFILSDMDRAEFKRKYGKEPMAFGAGGVTGSSWVSKDTVRVAEYFKKEPTTETLYLLEDGTVVTELPEGAVAKQKRSVESYKIMWYLLSGDEVLDSKEWAGKKYIPVIPVWGKEFNVQGRRIIRGLIRNAKDSQRLYNYWQSSDTETVALQPKVPFILTPKQIDGHEDAWKASHRKNLPYLLANPDKDAPGWPHREDPPQLSSAMTAKLRDSDQEIRDTMGIQRASMGMQSNERSGAALREQKREGDVGTYAFIDNLSRSLEHTGRILIDLAPSILDTERVVRLGLTNGEQEFAIVNMQAPNGKIFNDLSIGTYDVTVTVGPSYATQRIEARQSMQEFIQYYPDAAPLIGDLYAKSMDWPGAEEFAQRLEMLLPAEVKEKMAADAATKAGEPAPPPADSSAPPPDPEQELKLQEAQIKLEEAQVKLEQEQVKLQEAQVRLDLLQSSSKEELRKIIEEVVKEGEGNETD